MRLGPVWAAHGALRYEDAPTAVAARFGSGMGAGKINLIQVARDPSGNDSLPVTDDRLPGSEPVSRRPLGRRYLGTGALRSGRLGAEPGSWENSPRSVCG